MGKFKLYALEDFPDSRAAPDWVVEDIIETNSLNLIFGDPESGKSLLAIDIACCIASGTPFHGHPCKHGRVVYVAGEGESGLKRRFDAWSTVTKIAIPNDTVFLSTEPQSLCSQGSQAIVQSISKIHPPSLIIIDTLSRNFGDGDENSTTDMNRFIKALDEIRRIHSSAILVLHHPGHMDKHRARGALTLKAALDSEYRTERNRSTGKITLINTKMKDFLAIKPLSLKIHQVVLDPQTSSAALVDYDSDCPPISVLAPKATKAGRGKNQKAALEELRKLMNGEDFVLFPRWKTACETKMESDDFKHVSRSLAKNGIIEIQENRVRKCD